LTWLAVIVLDEGILTNTLICEEMIQSCQGLACVQDRGAVQRGGLGVCGWGLAVVHDLVWLGRKLLLQKEGCIFIRLKDFETVQLLYDLSSLRAYNTILKDLIWLLETSLTLVLLQLILLSLYCLLNNWIRHFRRYWTRVLILF
jgi:hypothetical protein